MSFVLAEEPPPNRRPRLGPAITIFSTAEAPAYAIEQTRGGAILSTRDWEGETLGARIAFPTYADALREIADRMTAEGRANQPWHVYHNRWG